MALGLDRSWLGGGLLGRCESVELWIRGMSLTSEFFASCSPRNSSGRVVLLTFEPIEFCVVWALRQVLMKRELNQIPVCAPETCLRLAPIFRPSIVIQKVVNIQPSTSNLNL